jgi:hypothetical protein
MTKRYTRIRQIYAWIGFLTILIGAPLLVGLMIKTIL